MTDAPTWFDDEADAPARPRRRLVPVLGLGAGAWVLVTLVLLVRPAAHDEVPLAADATGVADLGEDAGGGATAPPPRAEHAVDPTTPGPAHPPTAPGGADEVASPAPPVGRQEAEALALAVVRGWLSDGGPDLAIPDIEVDRRGYLEHATVESVHVASDDLVVARVLAVLLLREEDRYAEAVLRHVAVPLTVTGAGARPAGPPWWLPSVPDLTTAPPATTTVHDPGVVDAVTAALEEAGYRVAVIADLRVSDGGALVAHVTATTPAGDEVHGPIWLGATREGFTVLGQPRTPPDGPAAPPGSAGPASPGG